MVNLNTYSEFIKKERLSQSYLDQAAKYFDPVLLRLVDLAAGHHQPLFVSLVGCQGSGKTTLSKYIQIKLSDVGLRCLVLSLDDFYLSRYARSELADRVHPLLKTRGVPGTHDIERLSGTLRQLKETGCVERTPCFDKAADDVLPEAAWNTHDGVYDVVLFEGWCWGTTHVEVPELLAPINVLEVAQDEDCSWRNYVNDSIKTSYEPLYGLFDVTLCLKAPSFEAVYGWRLEQEQKLEQELKQEFNKKGAGLMSAKQIGDFIQYYERITKQLLAQPVSNWDVVWALDSNRKIDKLSLNKRFVAGGQHHGS